MYLTYGEYKSFGGELTQTAFNKYGYQAEMKIRTVTHNRIKAARETDISEAVKRCIARLADIYAQTDTIKEEKFSSVSHDGMSLSLAARSSSDYEAEINEIVYTYLKDETDENGTPLLYMGVDA